MPTVESLSNAGENPARRCKFIAQCPMFPKFEGPTGLEHFKVAYCQTPDHVNCERFKQAIKGTMPPKNLLPNGLQRWQIS